MEGPFTIIFQDKIFDPHFNLASEEYLLQKQKKSFSSNILFVYRNNPSVVCGKNQSIWSEANLKYCRENQISVNKRVSGGGTVYHDLGNLNFSFFTARKSEWVSNFSIFNEPVISFLNFHKIKAHSNDRNDILIEDYKISGNAQHLSGNQMISHATLLFDADLKSVSSSLNHEYENVESTAIKSKKVPVTNIKNYGLNIAMEEFIVLFLDHMKNNLQARIQNGFRQEEVNSINDIAASKYSKNLWIYGNSPKTQIDLRLPYGDKINGLSIFLEKGKVQKVEMSSDNNVFNNLLKTFLLNELFSYESLFNKIQSYPVNEQKRLKTILNNLKL